MKRRSSKGLLLALTFTLLFSAALIYLSRRPLTIAAGRGPVRAAHTEVARTQTGGPTRHIGVVVSRAALDLTPRVEGRLNQLFVTVGQEVKANDRIALIDDESLKKDLALAQATLLAAKAGAERASIELGDARAKAQRRAEVSSELSKEEVAASKTAEKLGGASLSAASAAVAEQRARIAKLTEELKHTEVRAPFPGKIANAYVAPGAQLTTQSPIVRLVQNEDLCVRFAVPAQLAGELAVGRRIRFDLETLRSSLPGTIENVAPEVDPGSQMLYVEASLDVSAAARSKIQPGLVARVRLEPGDGERPRDDRAWRETTGK